MSRSEDGRPVGPLVTDGMVRLAAGTVRIGEDGVASDVGTPKVERRRAIPIAESDVLAGLTTLVSAAVAQEAYTSRGWATQPTTLIVDTGDVALTPAQAQDLKDELGLEVNVERVTPPRPGWSPRCSSGPPSPSSSSPPSSPPR